MQNFIIFVLLMVSTPVLADRPEFICTARNAEEVISIARRFSSNDKNNHCSVSCLLALRCSKAESFASGILKEIRDFFGSGNPEMADIRANRIGIGLVRNQRARFENECLEQCSLYYP
ncbi:MAG TPA: hypothetical protein VNJ01_07970 [Bacteriovoracaceae bacterium]|nr:hypothetical protein [Bacteriovoracaceae bacterium]